ncbi:hypothetical protein [Yoonia vestfoldensis]|nr:hypothetical protein [Yoonia vestfoldensis]
MSFFRVLEIQRAFFVVPFGREMVPEVIIPIGADFVADTNTQLSFAPRLICEQIKSTTKTSDCGTGGELGFSSTSEDGLSSADMRILLDRINGGTRSSFAFSVEHKF